METFYILNRELKILSVSMVIWTKNVGQSPSKQAYSYPQPNKNLEKYLLIFPSKNIILPLRN